MAKAAPELAKDEARKIAFHAIVPDADGKDCTELLPPSIDAIEQLAMSSSFGELRATLGALRDKLQAKLTLARACEHALDTPLKRDEGQKFSDLLYRGRLLATIKDAARDCKPLALNATDIKMVCERVGDVFPRASQATSIILMLDPAAK